MSIQIRGTIAIAGERRVEALRQTHVVTALVQVGKGFRFEVRMPFGEDVLKAEAAALACRRGAGVWASAEGASPRMDHGYAAIVLADLCAVEVDGRRVFP